MFQLTADALRLAGRFPQDAYHCGTLAIENVARVLYPEQDFGAAALSSVPSPVGGFFMSTLVQLCNQLHIDLVAAKRLQSNVLVVPSVVHLGLDHYAAIVEQAGSAYKVIDPSLGPPQWLSADAINAEASGFFMVPRLRIPNNWRFATAPETEAIRGGSSVNTTGYKYYDFDSGQCNKPNPCDCPTPPPARGSGAPPAPPNTRRPGVTVPGMGSSGSAAGCSSCSSITGNTGADQPSDASSRIQGLDMQGIFPGIGMPTWYVSEPLLNLWLNDEPLSYQPSRGARIQYRLRYKMLNNDLSASTSIFNVGPNWVFNWRSYMDVDPSNWNTSGYVLANVHWPDGSVSGQFAVYRNQSTGEFFTGATLIANADGSGNFIGITVNWADGSSDLYNWQATDVFGVVQKVFLSARKDPVGATTTLTYAPYSPSSGLVQLQTITDPDGKNTSFSYAANATSISQVTGPYGSFSLTYDASGNLQRIIDAVGIQSSMTYDATGHLLTLTTPYGQTSFSYNTNPTGSDTYSLAVTDPLSKHWLYVFCTQNTYYQDTYGSLPSDPLGTLDNLDNSRNLSFVWDPLQYAHLSTTNPDLLTANDYLLGRLRHWLTWSPANAAVNAVSLEQTPSANGSTAGQLTWFDTEGKPVGANNQTGTFLSPSVTTQILPDGTSSYIYNQRNSLGNITNATSTYTQSNGAVGTRTYTYNYAANSIDLISVYGANNEQLQGNSYNAYHQVLTSTNFVGDGTFYVTTYGYDASQRLSSRQLPSGLTSTYTYGTDGYLSQISDSPINRTSSFTWLNGDLRTLTDARGLQRTFTFDGFHRLTQISYPDTTFESFTYTTLDMTSQRDRLGNVTQYGYNADRQLISVTDPNSKTTQYGYCDCGSLTSINNALNQLTQFNYDYAGRMTSVLYPDTTSRSYGYNALGQLTSVTDANGTTTLAYNNQGLLKSKTSPNGSLFSTGYDNEDRPASVTDANGVTVNQTFDNLARVVTRTYPDNGVEGFSYNSMGVIAYTNQIGKVWQYGYDAAGRQTSQTTPNPETISNSYNAAGDLLTLIDGKNQTTRWGYDTYGRVTSKTNQANVQILTYAYDADNRLTNRWSQAFGNTSYGYDSIGNLLTVTYPHSHSITYGYDAVSHLTNMVDAAGTTTFTYTSAGDLATEVAPWASDTATYTYHTSIPHLRVGLTLQQPTGSWSESYAYDAGDRLSTLTSPAGTFSNTYLNAGMLLVNLGLPNTAKITNRFDTVARLLNTALVNSSGVTLNSHGYAYNTASQRTQHTRTDGSFVNYTYDNDGQDLTAVGSGGQSTENLSYGYDAAWNLSQRTSAGVQTSFTVNNQNELSSGPGGNYGYDNNGNLTSSSASLISYSYDDENELTSVSAYQNWRTDFVYDGLGRLRRRLEYTWINGWYPNGETRYIYDGGLVIQERNGSNNPTVSYTRGIDLSGSLQGAGGIGGLLARSTAAGSHAYYHCDGNGNITAMADGTQAIVANYRYDPFGRIIAQSGTLASANAYRFSSKEFLATSSMYYYGYRLYDPNLQRWLNRDPIGEMGGMNLYQFARNNPLSFVDRNGLDVYPVITIGGGPVGNVDHVDIYVDDPNGGYFGSSAAWGNIRNRWHYPILPSPDDSTVVKRIVCDKATDKKIADFMKAKKSSSFHIPRLTPYCASWSGECLNAGFPGFFPFGTGTFTGDISNAVDRYNFIGPPMPPPPPDPRRYFFP